MTIKKSASLGNGWNTGRNRTISILLQEVKWKRQRQLNIEQAGHPIGARPVLFYGFAVSGTELPDGLVGRLFLLGLTQWFTHLCGPGFLKVRSQIHTHLDHYQLIQQDLGGLSNLRGLCS